MSLEQIRAFLKSSEEVEFKARDRGDVYAWVCQALHQQRYRELKRRSRGLVRRYLEKLTGLSRAQITRLIAMYMEGKPVQPKLYRRRRFPQRYTQEDIVLLAATDEAHETPSGPRLRAESGGDAEDSRAGLLRFSGIEVPAPGRTVSGANVPAAKKPHVPAATGSLSAHSADPGGHRRTASTRAGRTSRLPASGYGSSRGSERSQRR